MFKVKPSEKSTKMTLTDSLIFSILISSSPSHLLLLNLSFEIIPRIGLSGMLTYARAFEVVPLFN